MDFDPVSFLMGKAAGGGGGGGDAWTLIGSDEFEVSTTSTSQINVGTIDCDLSTVTKDDYIIVHIRDKAGKRNTYFYGTDALYVRMSSGAYSLSYSGGIVIEKYSDTGILSTGAFQTYGIYVSEISAAGVATVKAKYSSSYSYTIDGTYKVEVYKLTPPFVMYE